MTIRISDTEFRLFRTLIEKESGILLADGKAYLLENRLARILEELCCAGFGELYLKAMNARDLRSRIIDAVCINETYWFRDGYPFTILQEKAFPAFRKEMESGERENIRILSAGCSSGQEPYSIAMTALEHFGSAEECRKRLTILATDISRPALAQAVSGKYDNLAAKRGLKPDFLDRYFRKTGDGRLLDERVRSLVTFKLWNLKDPNGERGAYDVVFLRNVLIYFSDPLKKSLFAHIADLLRPEGYLFLGTGETISGYSTAFDIVESGGAVYYRLKAPRSRQPDAPRPRKHRNLDLP